MVPFLSAFALYRSSIFQKTPAGADGQSGGMCFSDHKLLWELFGRSFGFCGRFHAMYDFVFLSFMKLSAE
ncbi:uncharacterized [Tachysurus ichikawai]